MSAAEPEVLTPETPAKKTRAIAKRNGAKPEAIGTLVEVADKDLVVEMHRPSMEEVLMRAVEQNASIETLERLQAMIERAQAAAAKREFLSALANFQSTMPVVSKRKKVKDKTGASRFSYAPIEHIKEMAQPHLAANGLSVTTGCRVTENKLIATATAYHVGGHSESREFEVPITLSQFMSDQQSFAAASSFAERYAYRQVLGIVTADDDNEARITPNEARASRQPVSQPKQTPTAQKAEAQKVNGGSKPRPDLEPAGEGEAIDANTIKGLTAAMDHAQLSNEHFKARFPKLNGLEQVKKKDTSVIMSWIADPTKN
jgi:hypothetical protein